MGDAASVESRVRAALDAAGVAYRADPTPLPVRLADRREVQFRPTLALESARAAEDRTVLVYAIEPATPWGSLRRLGAFRRTWGQEYHLLVVAPDARAPDVPREAYDTLVRESELARIAQLIGRLAV